MIQGAFIRKDKVLDAVEEMEFAIMEQYESKECSEEAAMYALRALAGLRKSFRAMPTVCMTNFEIKNK